MASDSAPRQYVPLTCHGHSRPVPHIHFSPLINEDYYMLSACKDGNPMLRDGKTGDWIGTFIGHKGAVWQAKLSHDAETAATASADFTAKVWDTHTGEMLYELKHNHIVRAIAYPPLATDMVATGGFEKKLRIFDLAENRPQASSPSPNAVVEPVVIDASHAFEIGAGSHTDSIKFIVWTMFNTTIITASGKTLRWFNIADRSCIKEVALEGEIKSCELVSLAPQYSSPTDIGGGKPVLAVAAGKSVHFYGGDQCDSEIKQFQLSHGVASVGLDLKGKKFVVGEEPGTWVRVYSWDDGSEIDIHKGHHGPVWSVAFSPDGKLYATASEDGTIKMWKNCDGFYGLWKGGAAPVSNGNPGGNPSAEWDPPPGASVSTRASDEVVGHANAVHSIAASPNHMQAVATPLLLPRNACTSILSSSTSPSRSGPHKQPLATTQELPLQIRTVNTQTSPQRFMAMSSARDNTMKHATRTSNGSDLLVSYDPISILDSSPIYERPAKRPGTPPRSESKEPSEENLSPGSRKKRLFLQRLDRRGLSHSDPQSLL